MEKDGNKERSVYFWVNWLQIYERLCQIVGLSSKKWFEPRVELLDISPFWILIWVKNGQNTRMWKKSTQLRFLAVENPAIVAGSDNFEPCSGEIMINLEMD